MCSSYSHKDKEYVHKLADAMQSQGFDVWIDDRIDYGTRWPTVIETAIDSCDAFILVASSNSHESEWVQHEFVRAQRLQKQIFPILLEGNPWISFESTQYVDIRNGTLPTHKFYNTLRKYANRHLETMRKMAFDNWPVYKNKKIGFSIRYPLEGKILHENDEVLHIGLPTPQGTNLKKRIITIHFNESGKLSSPYNHNIPPFESSNVEILGLRFLRESDSEGGVGILEDWTSYSISQGNKVVTTSIVLTTANYHMYYPHLLPRLDLAAEKETILYALTTFSWLN
jgi:hypothetical protein